MLKYNFVHLNRFENMKPILILVMCLTALTISSEKANGQGRAIMTFEETTHDFGVVEEGAKAEHIFEFTNTGNVNLKISDVRTTCFCTVSEWAKGVIAPGAKGSIIVNFDTEGKSGPYAKGINVFSNAGENNLIIDIVVKAKTKVVKPKEVEPHDHEHDHDHDSH
jgi:Protein of unknown function (DUF1573)